MFLQQDNSLLLLIDVQEKLVLKINDVESIITRCKWLLNLANDLGVPVLVTEQYPDGLGATISSLLPFVNEADVFSKVDFSCRHATGFMDTLEQSGKKQIILVGIEAHVCVLQSALDLHSLGYEVFVVVDAIGSRALIDYKYALKRLRQYNVTLVTAEMVFFEWLGRAGTEEFKTLSKKYF